MLTFTQWLVCSNPRLPLFSLDHFARSIQTFLYSKLCKSCSYSGHATDKSNSVHTHDSAGTGVASMVACAQAGADAVDAATDSMSGMTSQPSIGAILASLEGSEIDTGLDANQVRAIDSYWAQTRLIYSPFEAGLTGPDSGKSLLLCCSSHPMISVSPLSILDCHHRT